MRPEGSDLNEGQDEHFEAVSWITSSVGSFEICGKEKIAGKKIQMVSWKTLILREYGGIDSKQKT